MISIKLHTSVCFVWYFLMRLSFFPFWYLGCHKLSNFDIRSWHACFWPIAKRHTRHWRGGRMLAASILFLPFRWVDSERKDELNETDALIFSGDALVFLSLEIDGLATSRERRFPGNKVFSRRKCYSATSLSNRIFGRSCLYWTDVSIYSHFFLPEEHIWRRLPDSDRYSPDLTILPILITEKPIGNLLLATGESCLIRGCLIWKRLPDCFSSFWHNYSHRRNQHCIVSEEQWEGDYI